MQLSNIRLGFATNSSSSHSIVICPSYDKDWNTSESREFGWEDFCLRSKEQKTNYLIATIVSNMGYLGSGFSEDQIATVINEVFGQNPRELASSFRPITGDESVDHQSLLCTPNRYNSDKPDIGFIRDMKTYLVDDPNIAICGGNDNEEGVDYGGTRDYTLSPIREVGYKSIVRKDGDWWVIFNRRNGGKVRLSFKKDAGTYNWADRPELADIKITDYCPYGCKFCYMDSTTKGKHGDISRILRTLDALAAKECFEVALGGGETTMHPNFSTILYHAKNIGIVPSFTSFSTNWMHDKDISTAVNDNCGGFAISVQHSEQDKFRRVVDDMSKWTYKLRKTRPVEMVVQCVAELNGTDAIIKMIDELTATELVGKTNAQWEQRKIFVTLTLLGYKKWGRANEKDLKPVDLPFIFEYAREVGQRISIDTTMANRYADVIDKKVNSLLMTTDEGAFSCYIDTVKNTLSPCSYSTIERDLGDDVGKALSENFPFPGFPREHRSMLASHNKDVSQKNAIHDMLRECGYTSDIVRMLAETHQ